MRATEIYKIVSICFRGFYFPIGERRKLECSLHTLSDKHNVTGIHRRERGYLPAVGEDDELASGYADMACWQASLADCWKRGLGASGY